MAFWGRRDMNWFLGMLDWLAKGKSGTSLMWDTRSPIGQCERQRGVLRVGRAVCVRKTSLDGLEEEKLKGSRDLESCVHWDLNRTQLKWWQKLHLKCWVEVQGNMWWGKAISYRKPARCLWHPVRFFGFYQQPGEADRLYKIRNSD